LCCSLWVVTEDKTWPPVIWSLTVLDLFQVQFCSKYGILLSWYYITACCCMLFAIECFPWCAVLHAKVFEAFLQCLNFFKSSLKGSSTCYDLYGHRQVLKFLFWGNCRANLISLVPILAVPYIFWCICNMCQYFIISVSRI
jgi:hypothetical protein